jgi:drug/metabolite transporter (DMT)-like permease
MPLLPAMFWRYLLAVGILYILARRIDARKIGRKKAIQLMAVGGLGQALITYLSLRALDYLPVGPLAFLFYTYPAWVAVISGLARREELTVWRLGALSIAMAGIIVMVGAPSAAVLNRIGVVMALGTALLYAFYLPALHKVQQGIPPLVASFYLVSGVLLSFLIVNVYTGDLRLPPSANVWGLLIVVSLVCTILAFVTLVMGLRVLGPVRTSIISTIEPFFTALLGALLLGERFTSAMLTGGLMIAVAVVLLQLKGNNVAELAA